MQVSTHPNRAASLGADVALLDADGIFPAGCPSRTVLDHVSSKWGVLILVALSKGPHRWSELRRRAEGISEKMLAQTLRHWRATVSSAGTPSRSFLPGLTTASPTAARSSLRCSSRSSPG